MNIKESLEKKMSSGGRVQSAAHAVGWSDGGWDEGRDITLQEEKTWPQECKDNWAALEVCFRDLRDTRNPLLKISKFGVAKAQDGTPVLKGTAGVLYPMSGPLKGYRVRVEPKRPLNMLSIVYLWLRPQLHCLDVDFSQLGDTNANGDMQLILLLGATLCEHLERFVQHNMLTKYRTIRQAMGSVRGRPDFSNSITKGFDPIYAPTVCQFSALSVDVPENQIIKLALTLLLERYLAREQSQYYLFRRLNALQSTAFCEVSDITSASIVRLHTDDATNADHYVVPLRIAHLIISGQGGVSVGDNELARYEGFMCDTAEVWEDYVRWLLAQGNPHRVRGHEATRKLRLTLTREEWGSDKLVKESRKRKPEEPDFLFDTGEVVVVVGEIKYQTLESGRRLGLFQLESYLSLAQCNNGMIVFLSAEGGENFLQYKAENHRIWIISFVVFPCPEITLSYITEKECEVSMQMGKIYPLMKSN